MGFESHLSNQQHRTVKYLVNAASLTCRECLRPFQLADDLLEDLQHGVTVIMLTRQQVTIARQRAQDFLRRAGIVLAETERDSIEVTDFGLGELDRIGLEIVTYINTDRCCAKELVLFPRQTCPEHRYPPIAGEPGKEETFRCRWGKVFLYVEGPRAASPRARPPEGREHTFTVWNEIEFNPGDQHASFRIPSIGSKQDPKEQSCLNSLPGVGMRTISSPTQASGACRT